MAHPSKIKGNTYERELVKAAKKKGLSAERAYASNGLSLGECEETDLLIEGQRVQAKRRKKIAGYIKPPEGTDSVAVREDRGDTYFVIKDSYYYTLVKVLKMAKLITRLVSPSKLMKIADMTIKDIEMINNS